jgi:hypothetical protein
VCHPHGLLFSSSLSVCSFTHRLVRRVSPRSARLKGQTLPRHLGYIISDVIICVPEQTKGLTVWKQKK